MDGFKDSTRTCYFSHGGKVRGAAEHSSTGYQFKRGGKADAKVAKVMGEFGEGKLRSGSDKGPVVTNPKQAVAIAISETKRKPMKKAGGGEVTDNLGRRPGVPVASTNPLISRGHK